MTTASVPLPAELEAAVNKMAKERGSNKAEVIRHAIKRFIEDEAVETVLRAQQEISEGKGLTGDLCELVRKTS